MTIFIKTHFYKLRRTHMRAVVAVVVAVAAVVVAAVAAVAVVTAAAPHPHLTPRRRRDALIAFML